MHERRVDAPSCQLSLERTRHLEHFLNEGHGQ
jgi:hypothetical protein